MEKWADYLISKVKYNVDHTRIISVKRHADNGKTHGKEEEVDRLTVVSDLRNGKSYVTVKKSEGGFDRGEDVRTIKIGDEYFIRTDKNETDKDNLGELPEF